MRGWTRTPRRREEMAETLSDALLRRTMAGYGPRVALDVVEPAAQVALQDHLRSLHAAGIRVAENGRVGVESERDRGNEALQPQWTLNLR